MAKPVSREAVLAEARRVFCELESPTMEQVAAAAGVAPTTVYRLFKTRRQLVEELGLKPPPTAEERLLRSAAEILAERGLGKLSVEDAAARAGVSRATAYRLFPGKGPLFKGIVRNLLAVQDLEGVLRSMWDAPPKQVMPLLAESVVRLDAVQLAIVRTLLFERHEDTEEGFQYFIEVGALMETYLAEQMARGRLRSMPPGLASQMFWSQIWVHLVNRAHLEGVVPDMPVSVAIAEIVDGWLRAMRPTRR